MRKCKPILFSTPMVKAILDGRKTMTRRVIKPQPNGTFDPGSKWLGFYEDDEWVPLKKPYLPGDTIYVRETWDRYVDSTAGQTVYIYKTHDRNKKILEDVGNVKIKWRPSIHMPREAARIFLRVTDIRVERLQDISPEDVDAEGAKEYGYSVETGELLPSTPTYFSILWDNLYKARNHGAYAWDANPWVWVIQFERTETPGGWHTGRKGG